MEALALASGSPWQGAAIMAVFVIGTSPLFAILGYAARKAATVWRGRLVAATGVAVIAMGLYTLNGGLELAGSPLAASRILETRLRHGDRGPHHHDRHRRTPRSRDHRLGTADTAHASPRSPPASPPP